jgi:4-amino-4-deoxy-L-arabinose transferase-like glycosyltransferase
MNVFFDKQKNNINSWFLLCAYITLTVVLILFGLRVLSPVMQSLGLNQIDEILLALIGLNCLLAIKFLRKKNKHVPKHGILIFYIFLLILNTTWVMVQNDIASQELYRFHPITNYIVILLGLAIIIHANPNYKEKVLLIADDLKKINHRSKEKIANKETIQEKLGTRGGIIAISVILCIFFALSLIHLGKFMSIDEPKWFFQRIPQYISGITQADLEKTNISDKPGILVAILVGISQLVIQERAFSTDSIDTLYALWRLPIILFTLLALAISYHFTRLLTSQSHAILTIGLIAFSPIIIGITQVANPDATLWSTTYIAFITFFLYLKTDKRKYIIYSGIWLGLALLSKYIASVYFIFFIAIIYIEYITSKKSREKLFERLYFFSLLTLIAIATYGLLFPFTWLSPNQLLKGTISTWILNQGKVPLFWIGLLIFYELIILRGKITNWIKTNANAGRIILVTMSSTFSLFTLFLGINLLSKYKLFDFPEFTIFSYISRVEAKDEFVKNMLSNGYVFVFSMVIPVIFAVLFYSINALVRKQSEILILLSSGIFITIIGFLFATAKSGTIAYPRYQIILFPLSALITSLFFLNKFSKKHYTIAITSIVIGISLMSSWRAKPFYLHYTNATNIHDTVVNEAWGYGGFEVAQYTNKLPNAENLNIWVDREGFGEFAVSNIFTRNKAYPFNKEDNIDYIVLTEGGNRIYERMRHEVTMGKSTERSRKMITSPLLEYYTKVPEYEICIHNNPKNCTRLIKIDPADQQ